MTNEQALNQIRDNLRHYWRIWRYALARGLTFASKYAHKVQACVDALGWTITPYALTPLISEA